MKSRRLARFSRPGTLRARLEHTPDTLGVYSGYKVQRKYSMSEETDDLPYYAYMLRLWRSESQGCQQWRASLESPHTGERHVFSSLEQLYAFLSERCKDRAPGAVQEETEVNGR